MIREATLADVERLVELGVDFMRESQYAEHMPVNPKAMATLAISLIQADHGLVLVHESEDVVLGMIGVIATFHPHSGEPVMSELFWYVAPESRGAGVKLMLKAEDWARSHGLVKSIMISPAEKVSHFYRRMGYQRLEEQFIKAL